jgi:hypothetical protein
VAISLGGQLATKNTIIDSVEKLKDIGCGGICFTSTITTYRTGNGACKPVYPGLVRDRVPQDPQGNLIYKPTDRPQGRQYPNRPLPTPTWETIQQLRDLTKLPVIIREFLPQKTPKNASRPAYRRR